MEAKAKLRYVRLSPRKTRLVVDMVRGKGVQEALNILRFSPQKAAGIVYQLVGSAVANAEQKGVADVDRLYIKSIAVDQGPVLKRFMPRAQGRATRIRKPTSHITVVLNEK
ncbi:MAG: 50S ribosomal protein L22 [Syntrophotalea acetylenica]|jgi:large subunit ribosomal protein L22|uniref:Large ribosomal subunit protein uL22 n=1 Tax=Syntrophotalea acetylenica TaxID=29542 RepID=A0A1L3GE13_SYNAC|nr:50S ribosomal protein L22 [Syntrophotalea acetylenica]APG24190.1 50S ribosomal protein L22 [Syntrophotalea acetylenica]APG44771.1 50S ribosomal protein L22 [Syntrophotalea acetylenica]MDD4456235.1 50S ribosomal protein L22 [Syntrophotalea acetylenica]MDY0261850.1 50S ribosomal protein L22 [Syntrophotalea acetylenica]